jgi:hypothetical protein
MENSLDILQLFGFTDSDLKMFQSDPAIQKIYELMIVPRKKFVQPMVSKLDHKILYAIYKILQKNVDTKILLQILDSQIKQISYVKTKKNDKTGKSLKMDKINRIKSIIRSASELNKDIDTYYLNQVEEIEEMVQSKSKGSEYKKTLLQKYDQVNREKNKMLQQIIINSIPLFEHSELLGDVILAHLVDQVLKNMKISVKTKDYDRCLQNLKRFLNSNVFLNHILKEMGFIISKLIPDIKTGAIRLAKRKNTEGRMERITSSCIDFKYNSNLFEQLIAYLFLMKGYDYTLNVFEQMLEIIRFDPKDYVVYCMNHSDPYPGIQLKQGCSCVDAKTNTAKCDNPGPFEPENFTNLDCPRRCRSGTEFNLEDLFKMKSDDILLILKQLSDVEITDLLFDIFTFDMDSWITLLTKREFIEALKKYYDSQKEKPSYRLFKTLQEILLQYEITKEDIKGIMDDDILIEMFNKGLTKRLNLGIMLSLYFKIYRKATVKNEMKEYLAKYKF